MPRKYPVAPIDREIGRRLRDHRESKHIPREVFARLTSISSQNLYSYETGRVPLPWKIAYTICSGEGLNFRWLATGIGPKFPHIAIASSVISEIPDRLSFSEAYAHHIDPYLKAQERRFSEETGGKILTIQGIYSADYVGWCYAENASEVLDAVVIETIRSWSRLIPKDEVRIDFLNYLLKSIDTFLEENRFRITTDGDLNRLRAAIIEYQMAQLPDPFANPAPPKHTAAPPPGP